MLHRNGFLQKLEILDTYNSAYRGTALYSITKGVLPTYLLLPRIEKKNNLRGTCNITVQLGKASRERRDIMQCDYSRFKKLCEINHSESIKKVGEMILLK